MSLEKVATNPDFYYLHNRRQCFRENGNPSNRIAITIGVPKGSCLGLPLFLLNINDLPFSLSKAHATTYDTATSFSSAKIEEINTVVNAELS